MTGDEAGDALFSTTAGPADSVTVYGSHGWSRTPAKGIVHTWPPITGHPASPWPFGTVLQPIDDLPRGLRLMWIGTSQVITIHGWPEAPEMLEFAPSEWSGWEPVPEPKS